MKAVELYGTKMDGITGEAFNTLWNQFSSTQMGVLRRSLRSLTGHHCPPAPHMSDDIWEWRSRLVAFCDALLVSSSAQPTTGALV